MINARNRQYISDGKTGGYPTLQSIWWKYIESEQTVGLPNNKYTYQNSECADLFSMWDFAKKQHIMELRWITSDY